MDTATQNLIDQLTSTATLPPALLWIGPDEFLANQAKQFLQKRWCPHHGCTKCITCQSIDAINHHHLRWFNPQKRYTRDLLDDLFSTISFSLEEGEEYFFVIQKADYLTPACFNSLLKSMEEPPAGYHFLLLAQHLHMVAATIRSRCIIHQWHTSQSLLEQYPIISYFLTQKKHSPADFVVTLEQSSLDEQKTVELLDELLGYWLAQYAQPENKIRAKQMISLIKHALEEPPMPGGSTMFWKQFFIQVYENN